MRKLLFLIPFLALVTIGQIQAAPNEKLFHLYGAFGELYAVSSLRIGHKTWELGKLNGRTFGIAKLLYKGNFYTAFGPVITQNTTPGFYGGVGFETEFMHIFSFRVEANAAASYDNFTYGEILVGATFFL